MKEEIETKSFLNTLRAVLGTTMQIQSSPSR